MQVKNDSKLVTAWCFYDWANSVYALVITSAIFPVYYQAVAKGADGSDVVEFFGLSIQNSVLYSYALSFSFLVSAIMLPMLSGIADYSGRKKFFLKVFATLGSVSCAGLYFFEGSNIEWAIGCSILASIGYSSGLVFYDAFLPEIVSHEEIDRTSARGYSFGYVGSVILMVINIVMIEQYEFFGFFDQLVATRFSFLMVGIWWIGFAQITLFWLPDNINHRRPVGNAWINGYLELRKAWQSMKGQVDLRKYLAAFFFYNMGVQTVMYLAATFGSKELKLADTKLIVTVLLIQLVAIAGANIFARISSVRGNIFSLKAMNVIWIFICIAAYFITTEYHFYAIAIVVGVVMGGIQSLSRATYAKMIPPNTIDHASFFSFYDVLFSVSIVAGTFTYGLIEQLTGSMRNSTIALGIFFIVGLSILSTIVSTPGINAKNGNA